MNIENLVKTFKSNTVLKNLNLKINASQRVALVGHNGCGKTTLIRCLLGLYQFEGHIDIFGVSIKQDREAALKKIAFVPQIPPSLKGTVKEIISLAAELCNFHESQIGPIAQELGLNLTTCLSTPFKNLSGGMKQKLLIAIALTRKPELLIMDEPSANLDPGARAVFFRLLSELPKETTMLLTSHRVDELSGIVSRVIELDNGVITMDDIVEANSEALTGKLICRLELKNLPDSVKQTLKEWLFTTDDPQFLKWRGTIPAADSFRFHATLTRWSGIIESVSIQQNKDLEEK